MGAGGLLRQLLQGERWFYEDLWALQPAPMVQEGSDSSQEEKGALLQESRNKSRGKGFRGSASGPSPWLQPRQPPGPSGPPFKN